VPGRDSGEGGRASGGFVEGAWEAGVTFKTSFLPTEQGEKFKVNLYDHGAGLAIADVDGDGDDDLFFCNQLGSNALYRNDGGRRFTDVTARAGVGLAQGLVKVAAAFADVDGDGDPDLYVTTTRGGNVFFRNRGDGTFEEATAASGLALVAHSQQPTFFDADRDGDPDLLVTNTARWTTEEWSEGNEYRLGVSNLLQLLDSQPEPNRFWTNDGKGRFTDATEAAGLTGVGWGGDTAVLDFDDDGDLDLFVGNMFGRSLLYENDGRGRFSDATAKALGVTSWGTVGAKLLDADVDGRLDLFLVDMHSDMWMRPDEDPATLEPARKFSGPYGPLIEKGRLTEEEAAARIARRGYRVEEVVFGNTLFRNRGGGRYVERSDAAGLETLWPWGIAAADFDLDGDEDVYLPSGMGFPYAYLPSPLFLSRGDGTFEEVAARAGLDPPPGGVHLSGELGGRRPARSARAAATSDLDGDGRVDLVVTNFNDRAFLWWNEYPRRRWLALRLLGTASGRDAVGAVATVRVGERTLVRQVQAAGGYLAQSSRVLHFGLGDAERVGPVEVRWPSGKVQRLEGLALDRRHDVEEPR
jgi:hypothetical protein